MGILNILETNGIKTSDELVCLNDIISKLVKSKSPESYMDKICGKQKKDNEWYISIKEAEKIILRGKAKCCVELSKEITKENNPNKDILDKCSQIDQENFGTINRLFKNKNLTIITLPNDEVWFRGNDVADILEYNDAAHFVKLHVEPEDKKTYENLLTLNKDFNSLLKKKLKGNEKNTAYINESGLYCAIMGSRKKEAKEFKRWVTHEVLPSLRKTGEYKTKHAQENKTLPSLMYDINKFKDTNCVYIINVRDNLYKFGITSDMQKRAKDHFSSVYKDDQIVFQKIYKMEYFDQCKKVEDCINNMTRQLQIDCQVDKNSGRIYSGGDKVSRASGYGRSYECFAATIKYPIDSIISVIDEYVEDEKNKSTNEIQLQSIILQQKILDSEQYTKTKTDSLNEKKLEVVHTIASKANPASVEEYERIVNMINNMCPTAISNQLPPPAPLTPTLLIKSKIDPIRRDLKQAQLEEHKKQMFMAKPPTDTELDSEQESNYDDYEGYSDAESEENDLSNSNNETALPEPKVEKKLPKSIQKSQPKKIRTKTSSDKKNKIDPQNLRPWRTGICIDCKGSADKKSTRCLACLNKHRFVNNVHNSNRPSYEQLLSDKKTMTWVDMGKKYKVSDNGVRKWMKLYEKYK